MRRLPAGCIALALTLGWPWLATTQAGLCCQCAEREDACASCEPKPACEPCEVVHKPCRVQVCEKRKVPYCTNKVTWKLVSEKCTVPKTKYVKKKDPCDPCKIECVPVTTYRTRTKYRWERTVTPVWKEKTITVCTWQPACSDGVVATQPAMQ